MITKKNNIFYVAIYYRDPITGAKKYKWTQSGTSYKDAEKLERKLLKQRDDGARVRAGKDVPKLAAFLDRWLDTCVRPPAKKNGTYKNYAYVAGKAKAAMGKRRLDKITGEMLDIYYRQLADAGLSATTIRTAHRVLRLAFGQAIKWHILDVNPAWDATPPAPKKAKNHALTTDDAMALLAYAETYQPTVNQCDRGKLLSIIILCMICGLRRGEAAGLRWDHVDLGRKVLTVTWSLGDAKLKGLDESLYPYVKHCRPVVRKGKQLEPGALILDTVKTPASDQVVPIPGFVVNFLRKRKVAYDTKKLQLGPAFHDDGFVMCGDNGDPFHPNGLYKNIVSLIACYNKDHPDAPLTRVTVHDLRHTFATMLLEGHQDVKVVSRSLRHANAAITRELYQHVTERLQNEATEYMETLLQPPQKTEMHKQA